MQVCAQSIITRLSCRSLVDSVSTTVTKERCYAAAWVVSTVALTALTFYAPVTFFLGGIALSALNAVYFSRTVNEGNASSKTLRTWMIVACFVMSAALGAGTLRCLPFLKTAFNAIKSFQLESLFGSLFVINGVVGCVGPMIQTVYNRGLELLKSAKWEQMDTYLTQTELKEQVRGIINRVIFFVDVLAPNLSSTWGANPSTSALMFTSKENRLELLKEQISQFRQVMPYIELMRKSQTFNRILATLKTLSNELSHEEYQDILIQLINIAHGIEVLEIAIVIHLNQLPPDKLPPEKNWEKLYLPLAGISRNAQGNLNYVISSGVSDYFKSKSEEVTKDCESYLKNFEAAFKSLSERIEVQRKEKNEEALDKISTDLSKLRADATKLISLMPTFDRSPYQISSDALPGFFQDYVRNLKTTSDIPVKAFYSKIEVIKIYLILLDPLVTNLIDVKGKQEDIDPTDATWNYFLMNAPAFSNQATGFSGFYDYFKVVFKTENNDVIDKNLEDLHIGTMSDFIVNVLGSKEVLLKGATSAERERNILEIRQRLDAYITSRSTPDSRDSIYLSLAGRIRKDGSKWVDLASRVAYRAIMILTSLGPIIVYPWHAITAFSISLVCNSIPCLRRRIAECADSILEMRTSNGSAAVLQLAIRGYRIAANRPFLGLFSRQNPPREMQTFERAGLFGRMRILSMESLYGFLLLVVNPEGVEEFGTGGIVQGLAFGTEIHNHAARAFRRICPPRRAPVAAAAAT